eukprot:TRINITY_DN13418_c0_g1_i1.p1 TRINITY_DN13418_c0_g1~~TRINITY_DN13418_c0_g1_i1.p1  ORF type:complete len:104 (+),score=0.08 TRINITY_DN13418_c0_g1_i1:181-492(+)
MDPPPARSCGPMSHWHNSQKDNRERTLEEGSTNYTEKIYQSRQHPRKNAVVWSHVNQPYCDPYILPLVTLWKTSRGRVPGGCLRQMGRLVLVHFSLINHVRNK